MTMENQLTEVIHAPPEISKIPSKHHFAVSVRVRPLTPQESLMGEHASTISVFDENVVIFDPSAARASRSRKGISDHHKRTKEHRYAFDRVFSAATSQMEVFEHTTKPLIDGVLDGYNATVFAYGATGAGKTHTMAGTPSDPGIMVLTMCELFGRIKELENEKIIDLRMTYLEIYNETIRDLLVDSSGTLDMREDDKKGIVIPSLSEHTPEDVQQVMALLKKGNANRMMSPTMANATSSRSHAVLQIHIQQRDRTANIASEVQCAKLTLIDLAGSERASVTQNKTERFREGANINRSLLALGNCINALCSPRKGHHIPYRDSKLTRLLKYSLGGNCRTVMIAAVSPSIVHFEDTYNTLVYANRAKNIKTNVERNTVSVNYHIRQYTQIISDLRLEIAELKEKMNNEKTEEATVTLPQMNEISILNSKRQMDEMIKELETIKNILVANESYCAALNGQSTLYEVLIDIKCFLASIGDYLEEKENEIYFRLEEFEKFISMQFEQLEVDLAHLWNESETIRAGLIELNSQANNKLLNDHLVLFEQLVGQSRTEIEKEEFMMYHQVQQTIIDFQRFWTLRVFDYLKENPNHSKSSWMNLCENFFSIDLVKSVINEGEFRSCSRLSISSLDKSRLSILSGHEFVIHSPRSLSARRPQTSVKIGSLKQDSSDILINSPSTPKIQKSAPLINSTVKDALQTWFQNDSLKSTPRKHKSLSTTPLSRSVADFKKFKKTNSFSASKEGLFTNLQEKLEKAKKSKQSLEKIDDVREVKESLENSFGSVKENSFGSVADIDEIKIDKIKRGEIKIDEMKINKVKMDETNVDDSISDSTLIFSVPKDISEIPLNEIKIEKRISTPIKQKKLKRKSLSEKSLVEKFESLKITKSQSLKDLRSSNQSNSFSVSNLKDLKVFRESSLKESSLKGSSLKESSLKGSLKGSLSASNLKDSSSNLKESPSSSNSFNLKESLSTESTLRNSNLTIRASSTLNDSSATLNQTDSPSSSSKDSPSTSTLKKSTKKASTNPVKRLPSSLSINKPERLRRATVVGNIQTSKVELNDRQRRLSTTSVSLSLKNKDLKPLEHKSKYPQERKFSKSSTQSPKIDPKETPKKETPKKEKSYGKYFKNIILNPFKSPEKNSKLPIPRKTAPGLKALLDDHDKQTSK